MFSACSTVNELDSLFRDFFAGFSKVIHACKNVDFINVVFFTNSEF